MAGWKGFVATLAALLGLAAAQISHAQAPVAPILEAPAIFGSAGGQPSQRSALP